MFYIYFENAHKMRVIGGPPWHLGEYRLGWAESSKGPESHTLCFLYRCTHSERVLNIILPNWGEGNISPVIHIIILNGAFITIPSTKTPYMQFQERYWRSRRNVGIQFFMFMFFFQKKKERSLNPLVFIKDFKKIEWDNLWDIFLVRFLLGFSVLVSLSTLGSVHIEFG